MDRWDTIRLAHGSFEHVGGLFQAIRSKFIPRYIEQSARGRQSLPLFSRPPSILESWDALARKLTEPRPGAADIGARGAPAVATPSNVKTPGSRQGSGGHNVVPSGPVDAQPAPGNKPVAVVQPNDNGELPPVRGGEPRPVETPELGSDRERGGANAPSNPERGRPAAVEDDIDAAIDAAMAGAFPEPARVGETPRPIKPPRPY